MKFFKPALASLACTALCSVHNTFATNPLITDQFTADPTARVFEGKIYVYPSHDIFTAPGTWFRMEDYHVFSSENLTDWTDHGMILNQTNVPWLNGRKSYDMWAPDCLFKNGKYYFYFPTGGRIGVAIADKPYGPFQQPQSISGANGIDPGLLQDKDGSAYIFWARGSISVAKLKDNLVELDGPGQVVANLPTTGLIEGPFPFERNGIYYLTYPHNANGHAERLEYATSTNPMGPYKFGGILTDESPSGCWTEHQSVVQYKDQWYLFYHDKDLSPNNDRNRSIRADYMYFNGDGSIKKVIPTLRGVGIVEAKSKIQIDRYSDISKEGVSDSFLDETNKFAGWKVSLKGPNTWVQFNDVDFGKSKLGKVSVRTVSSTGTTVEIHVDKPDGPLVAMVKIAKGADWQTVNTKLTKAPTGIHNLVVTQSADSAVDIDWVSFE